MFRVIHTTVHRAAAATIAAGRCHCRRRSGTAGVAIHVTLSILTTIMMVVVVVAAAAAAVVVVIVTVAVRIALLNHRRSGCRQRRRRNGHRNDHILGRRRRQLVILTVVVVVVVRRHRLGRRRRASSSSLVLWQGLLQQLHVKVVVLGHLALLALPYSVADVTLEAEPERYHRVANTVRRKGSTEIEVWYVPAILPSDGRLQVDEQNPQNDGWQTDALI